MHNLTRAMLSLLEPKKVLMYVFRDSALARETRIESEDNVSHPKAKTLEDEIENLLDPEHKEGLKSWTLWLRPGEIFITAWDDQDSKFYVEFPDGLLSAPEIA